MTQSLDELVAVTHDPAQTHLSSFERGSRGPYPCHPFGAVDGEDG